MRRSTPVSHTLLQLHNMALVLGVRVVCGVVRRSCLWAIKNPLKVCTQTQDPESGVAGFLCSALPGLACCFQLHGNPAPLVREGMSLGDKQALSSVCPLHSAPYLLLIDMRSDIWLPQAACLEGTGVMASRLAGHNQAVCIQMGRFAS